MPQPKLSQPPSKEPLGPSERFHVTRKQRERLVHPPEPKPRPRRTEADRRRRERFRAAGLCWECGRKTKANRKSCETCLRRRRERRAKKRAMRKAQ